MPTTDQMLRLSLKRGLAREAMGRAGLDDGDLRAAIETLRDLRPNPRNRDRALRRLARRRGVVSAVARGSGLVLILRSVRRVTNRVEGMDVFEETALLYTRLKVEAGRRAVRFVMHQLAICRHALERLIERSACALCNLLQTVDGEATQILDDFAGGRLIEENGDAYLSGTAGVWAGSTDATSVDPAWGLTNSHLPLPVFSVRTFLGESQMRPTVWLRWRDDPTMRLVA